MPLKELIFVTGNKNKLAEVQAILGGVIPLKSQSLDLTEIQGTIEEISKDKCRRAAQLVRPPFIVLLFNGTIDLRCPVDRWAGFDRGYVSLLQCFKGATRTVHVGHHITRVPL